MQYRRMEPLLQHSDVLFQEIKETMSLVSNDLFKLEDLVDTISSCAILPEFRLPAAEMAV